MKGVVGEAGQRPWKHGHQVETVQVPSEYQNRYRQRGTEATEKSEHSPTVPAIGAVKLFSAGESKHWWVQVGEFRSRDAARSQIEAVARRFSRLFDNAEGSVDGSGKAYRAMFTGLSEPAAREACSTVRSHGLPCIAGGRA